MPARCIALLTDFGLNDPFVGICHAVIRGQAPEVPIIDLTHGIDPQDIRAGAIALTDSLPFLPRDAIVVAVVDPGVGGDRKAVAVQTNDGLTLLGPDNGLLAPAIEMCGGAAEVVELSDSPWRLVPTSETFHGRDIFSPVAARIAIGGTFADAGRPIDESELVGLALPRPKIGSRELVAEVLDVDAFGNVRLAATRGDLEEAGFADAARLEIECSGLRTPAHFVRSFSEVAPLEMLIFEDASGWLSVAINQGRASVELGAVPGGSVRVLGA